MRCGAARVAGATVILAFALPAAQPHAGPVHGTTEVVSLSRAHKAVWALGDRGARGRMLQPWRPITGHRTVLPVEAHRTTADGVRWLRVRVPGRPNGRRGWIARRGTTLSRTSWKVVISTGVRRLRVYRRGRVARAFPAAV